MFLSKLEFVAIITYVELCFINIQVKNNCKTLANYLQKEGFSVSR